MNLFTKMFCGTVAALTMAACGSSVSTEDTDSTTEALNCNGVGTVYCVNGHWDSKLCMCVPDKPTCDPHLCIVGDHFDSKLCKCVPDCKVDSDCHGAVPQYCVQQCPNGKGDNCAHNACIAGACEVVTCN
jgi:hypothetical protein